MNKRITVILKLFIFICLTFYAHTIQAGGLTPLKNEIFPDITLPIPDNAAEKNYLGLEGKDSFAVSRIKADLVILEIFSMYCPYCQREAPIVNELYRIINQRKDLKDKIKIIGVGAGNNRFEVDVFRNQFNIQFPLFSDESFFVHKTLGEVRTPYFIVIKMNTDGSNRIIYSKVGSIHDANEFLDAILKESGLKQDG
jgi:peroxiredoxin